jgi:hypothetical protein
MENKMTDEMILKKLRVDGAPDLKFHGVLIAQVSSNSPEGEPSKSRWSELSVYRTRGGKIVCHSVGKTIMSDEYELSDAKAFEFLDEIFEFFGFDWLAKELYEDLNIEPVIEID